MSLGKFSRRGMFGISAGAVTATIFAGNGASAAEDSSNAALARSLGGGFVSEYAEVNGIRMHYVAGGRGEPLLLLHGYPQFWWEYHKVMPELAKQYRVIAVDLRGGGATSKPKSGYDKKNMATDIHELAKTLGFDRVNIAGHDIGAMVAFSFAINHPEATKKIALLDVTHPDESYYEFRMLARPGEVFTPWWFAFNQVPALPEQLIAGRSRPFTDYFFDTGLVNQSAFSEFDRRLYARNYAVPDAIRGANGWYQAFGTDIADMASYGKVTAPMFGLAAGPFFTAMAAKLPNQGTDVQVREIKNTGHYFIEEQPATVVRELTAFFG